MLQHWVYNRHGKPQSFQYWVKGPPFLHTLPCIQEVTAELLWMNRRESRSLQQFLTLLYFVPWASHLGKALGYLLRRLKLFRIQVENTHLALPSIFTSETLRPRLVQRLTQGCKGGSWQTQDWTEVSWFLILSIAQLLPFFLLRHCSGHGATPDIRLLHIDKSLFFFFLD